MTVTYETRVVAHCPADGSLDIYEVTITHDSMVQVEEILAAISAIDSTGPPIYQEHLTQMLADRLGATVTTVGFHSGVRTVAVA